MTLCNASRISTLLLIFWSNRPAHAAEAAVHYQLSFPNAAHHEAEVRATFSGITQQVLTVVASSSSPGRYAIHEFAKNIYNFRASDGAGRPLAVSRPSIDGWNVAVATGGGPVTVAYTVFGDRVDGTYAAIDETHAHLNMPAVLVWAHGFEHAPATLVFQVPEKSKWTAATQLIPNADGSFSSPNLEWLMDSPIELSAQTMRQWKVGDATFRMALHHRGKEEEADAYAALCQKIVLEEAAVFGGLPKYDGGTYTFLLDYVPYASYDGMEHRDSTVISGPVELSSAAHHAIDAVSHEFFHCWNVKRIRPKSLEPFDFEHADMSGELWFAEGFTNYYGMLALKRAGIWTLDEFVGGMSGALNAVLTEPGREVFSAVDMSRRAPFVDAARPIDPTNGANTFISYYTYGQALAFGIDMAIRERFPGKSLDDWMRTMWREHSDIDQPYTLADLERALAETTGDKTFANEMFERHINGKQPLGYAALLPAAGLNLQLLRPGKAWLGSQRLEASSSGLEIASATVRGSSLYAAGLDKGDTILECDGKPMKTTDQFAACVDKHALGEQLSLKVKARAGETSVEVTLVQDPKLELVTHEHLGKAVTVEMKAFRDALLESKVKQ